MARILVIADVPPAPSFPNGYSARLLHFLQALSADHVVDLLALAGTSMLPHFRQVEGLSGVIRRIEIDTSPLLRPTLWGKALRARHYVYDGLPFMCHPRSVPGLPALLEDEPPQLVVVYLPHLAHLVAVVPAAVPVICVLEEGWERALPVAASDLGGLRRCLISATERRRVHRLYAKVGQRCSGVVLISDDERRQFANLIPVPKLDVFPHGVDCLYYSPEFPITVQETVDIAVVADFSQTRNIRGLQEVISRLGTPDSRKFLGWRWSLVGRGSTEALAAMSYPGGVASLGHFEATGPVSDVREHYQKATVVLVPDLEGTGVKTTVLQAWAMGKAVVITRAATRGLPARPGVDLIVGDTPADLLQQLSDLLEHPTLREKLAWKGRETVTAHRDIRAIAASFAAYCGRTLSDH